MVNIIIPAYNAHNVIDIALKSIINQTIKDKIEVLVINDGSVKDYEDIIKKYKKYYKIREVTLKKNGGLYNAENTGIKEATGDYIMFLDADDYLAKNDAVERGFSYLYGIKHLK